MLKSPSIILRVLRYMVYLLSFTVFLVVVGFLLWLPISEYILVDKLRSVSGRIDFPGTIYKSHQVEPGTFSIIKPWSEVSGWAGNAIASYDLSQHNKIRITAWVPNEKVAGTFFKATWELNPKWSPFVKSKAVFYPESGEAVLIPQGINSDEIAKAWAGVCVFLTALLLGSVLITICRTLVWGSFEVLFKPSLTRWPLWSF